MDKNTAFGHTEIEKHKFHRHKNAILMYDVDTNKIIVSNKVSFGKKGSNILLVTKIMKNLSHFM